MRVGVARAAPVIDERFDVGGCRDLQVVGATCPRRPSSAFRRDGPSTRRRSPTAPRRRSPTRCTVWDSRLIDGTRNSTEPPAPTVCSARRSDVNVLPVPHAMIIWPRSAPRRTRRGRRRSPRPGGSCSVLRSARLSWVGASGRNWFQSTRDSSKFSTLNHVMSFAVAARFLCKFPDSAPAVEMSIPETKISCESIADERRDVLPAEHCRGRVELALDRDEPAGARARATRSTPVSGKPVGRSGQSCHAHTASRRSAQYGSICRNASQKSSNRLPFAACVFADCSKNSRSCRNVVIELPAA